MKAAALLAGLVIVNAVLLIAGAGRGDAPAVPDPSQVRVGLVFDVGGLGDKSFNDAAYRGLVAAERELGVAVRFIEPGDGSDRESAIRELASRGFDLVIGVGFIFSDDITRLALEFPDTAFACIDYSGPPRGIAELPPNLLGLRFREHEGSFLVGAIAGQVTETGKVGFVGGMKIPLIRKFEAGYAAGVRHVCPECVVLSAYAGTEPRAFADPTTGKELALTQYNRGADVIYHASGKTGAGVFNAARERGALAIGTDSNQFHEAPCCVLTSMIKGVDVGVLEAVRAVVRGRFEGGLVELGLAEGGVGFVYDHDNRHLLPAEVVDRVRDLERAIIAGDLEVPYR
jgi:basic membrane protein A and related proteins